MLTVLMATYNGASTLPKVLQAYCALQGPPGGWSLLVIDNGSDDSSRAVIAAFAPRLPLRYLFHGPRGKNAALNAGLAMVLADCDSSLLVFSDDDAAPAPDWLLRLEQCAAAHPDYALFGGAIVADWASPPPEWIGRLVPLGLTYGITAPELADGPVFPGLVWGANMALRRCIFDAGHRFDQNIGPNAGAYPMGSETLMNRRLFAAGYLSWFCPAARVAHYIRPHQLERDYLLARAHAFGRGKWRQDRQQQLAGLAPAAVPAVAGMQRWMVRQYATEALGALRAWWRGQADTLFLRRWELAFLAGYLREGRAARKPRRDGPPRVLISSYSGELGGMELRMAQEARVLAGAGYHSMLALRRFSGFDNWADTLRRDGVPVCRFDPPPLFEQWRWRRLNKLRCRLLAAPRLRSFRPDLVHVAFCWTTYGASILWLAHHCRMPCVISVHNAFPPATLSAWHQPLLLDAFRSVRGIYAVSESAMQHFLHLFQDFIVPGTRLEVITNSVDTARFTTGMAARLQARTALGLPPHSLVMGCVARLSVQKRPQALLAMFVTLSHRFPDLYLVLVGGGPLEPALRLQAEQSGLGPRVRFTGFVEQVEQVLPAFDLHLLLSRNEGFGISTIEAMACGVPVVGTDVPGTADILRDSGGGLLVPLHDEVAAAEAVAQLLADPVRRQLMGQRGRIEAEASYSRERLERQVLAFYASLI